MRKMHWKLDKQCNSVVLAVFPELQEFVMSLKQCSLIRGVAIVRSWPSLADSKFQIRIFPSRCLIGLIFVRQDNKITFVAAKLA